MDRTESRLASRDPKRNIAGRSDNNPERISWEILRTRQQMDRTLDELGLKLAEISRTVRHSVAISLVWIGVGALTAAGAAIAWRIVRHRRESDLAIWHPSRSIRRSRPERPVARRPTIRSHRLRFRFVPRIQRTPLNSGSRHRSADGP